MQKKTVQLWARCGASCRWLLSAAVVGLLPLLAAAQATPSGAYLLRKAQVLQTAGDYDAAEAAFNQATDAFRRVSDTDGQQRALAGLATMEEKRANQLLAGLSASATASAAPVPRAARPPVVRSAPTVGVAPPAASATPTAGRVVGGKPQGLFFMTRYILAFHSLEKASYYFAPTGQVYYDPQNFSAASLAALPASHRGSYSVSDGKLNVKWTDGHTTSARFENPASNSFSWDMGIFVGMGPFTSARQLVGAFEGGNSVSSSSGSAAISSGLTFRADGTYSGGSAATISTSTSASTVEGGSSGNSAGHWSLSGWYLTLTDSKGQRRTGLAYPVETDDKTGQVVRFYFDNVSYKRL